MGDGDRVCALRSQARGVGKAVDDLFLDDEEGKAVCDLLLGDEGEGVLVDAQVPHRDDLHQAEGVQGDGFH